MHTHTSPWIFSSNSMVFSSSLSSGGLRKPSESAKHKKSEIHLKESFGLYMVTPVLNGVLPCTWIWYSKQPYVTAPEKQPAKKCNFLCTWNHTLFIEETYSQRLNLHMHIFCIKYIWCPIFHLHSMRNWKFPFNTILLHPDCTMHHKKVVTAINLAHYSTYNCTYM